MFCREFSGWLLIPLILHLEVAVYWMTGYKIWRQTVKIWSRTVPYNVLKRWNMKSPVALNMRLIPVLGCLRHLRWLHDVFFTSHRHQNYSLQQVLHLDQMWLHRRSSEKAGQVSQPREAIGDLAAPLVDPMESFIDKLALLVLF
jgi:hypothetical protein